MTRTVTIADFLTNEQITAAAKLFDRLKNTGTSHLFAEACADEVIRPNMAEINRKLGEVNDPKYLAYAVEHVMTVAKIGK